MGSSIEVAVPLSPQFSPAPQLPRAGWKPASPLQEELEGGAASLGERTSVLDGVPSGPRRPHGPAEWGAAAPIWEDIDELDLRVQRLSRLIHRAMATAKPAQRP